VGSSHRSDPKLTRHVRAIETLDELFTAAEAVQALAAQPGWPVLLSLVDAEVSKIDATLEGRVHDQATYANLHGRRAGLKAVPALMEALIERADEKLAEQRRKHEGAGETALEVA
jgi:hypothetical protein